MHPQIRHIGSQIVRSPALVTVFVALISLPSVAAELPPIGISTMTQDDVPYGEVQRQLVMSQPSQTNGSGGGGGSPVKPLPQFRFIPALPQTGEGDTLIRSQPIQIHVIQRNQGSTDQTTKNVINFSF